MQQDYQMSILGNLLFKVLLENQTFYCNELLYL